MRTRLVLLIALVGLAAPAVLLAACGDDDDDAAVATATRPAQTAPGGQTTAPGSATSVAPAGLLEVEVSDNKYTPSNLTVPAGSKVTWVWTGQRSHSVEGTFSGQAVASEKQSGGSFSFAFATKGAFEYQCGIHGASMTGKVTVQ
jgi:plastocyanin